MSQEICRIGTCNLCINPKSCHFSEFEFSLSIRKCMKLLVYEIVVYPSSFPALCELSLFTRASAERNISLVTEAKHKPGAHD